MSLRVIAGSARGARLKAVPGDTTRPIMDRVKEALFSIIGDDIMGASMLDLFAGTGSVGIEALSRGAEQVHFVDRHRAALRTLRENLKHTRLEARAVLRQRDAFHVIKRPPERRFDFIYVAPPQYRGQWLAMLKALDRNPSWHHPNSLVIVQLDPRELEDDICLRYLLEYDRRVYGRTMLLFFEFADPANGIEERAD
ncbi:MAG: 16S rRNA (guanine(966)-N(2))-methyltransferase RsmD [Chloroflexota bacterium]|nr:16S rRNA (guanine(966)-N(2))-methyltransferase RsmD [Chloroflexota bacterium]